MFGKQYEITPEIETIVLKCKNEEVLTMLEFEDILHELDIDYKKPIDVKTDHFPRCYGEMITGAVDENGEPMIECRIYKPRNLELQKLLGGHDIRIWNVDYVWFEEYGGYEIWEGI